jgi:hypothetical protein
VSDSADLRRLDFARRYMRRTYTRAQIATLSDACMSAQGSTDKLSTILISTNFGASGGTAALTGLQPFDLGAICEDLIAEMDRAGVTSWTAAQSAVYSGPPAFIGVDFNRGNYLNGSAHGV